MSDAQRGPVVLLGFGGPQRMEDVRPFLDRVLAGRPVPPRRYEEVVDHYARIGGRSPFNELTARQAHALQVQLQDRGIDIPVRVAYRHTEPFISDVARELQREGAKPIAVILATHQSPVSWDVYRDALPNAVYTPPFFNHPLFVQAHVERIHEALASSSGVTLDEAALIFTAHSIPQSLAQQSAYERQLRESAHLIASRSGASRYDVAYQSRSGSPSQPWLEPDVREAIASLPSGGVRDAVVVPLGFLCDHVEVLYDLDIEAAQTARESGVRMVRAKALNDHPLFIEMLADFVAQCVA